MTRYTITVINLSDHNTNPEAVIGYDRRLQTFFLQAFPDAEGEDLALWIGTQYCAFETLTSLRSAAITQSYDFMPLSPQVLCGLVNDRARDAIRSPPNELVDEPQSDCLPEE
ncbi:hypothetical protein [Sinorhizobium terangae]|uniref:hypothetical protein n=1 Tax=Sinorhizobium terangae TaxID=110322 RepID=UPI0024B1B275|nr:hypothetical protein [Sinorhizobium terangae]WFU50209.1 hypothetical protein QA637_25815 [Sinorhizobium terangae]